MLLCKLCCLRNDQVAKFQRTIWIHVSNLRVKEQFFNRGLTHHSRTWRNNKERSQSNDTASWGAQTLAGGGGGRPAKLVPDQSLGSGYCDVGVGCFTGTRSPKTSLHH